MLIEEEKNFDFFDKVLNFNDIIVIVCEFYSMFLFLCIYFKEKVKGIKIFVILNDWGMLNVKFLYNLGFLKENKFVDYIIIC